MKNIITLLFIVGTAGFLHADQTIAGNLTVTGATNTNGITVTGTAAVSGNITVNQKIQGESIGMVLRAGSSDPLPIPDSPTSSRYLYWFGAKGSLRSGYYSTSYLNDTADFGTWSATFGYNARATGNYSMAVGYYATASGNHSIAGGYYSSATASESVALGTNAVAGAMGAFAAGPLTYAYGQASTALGFDTDANSYSLATGYSSLATGLYSVALGNCAQALGQSSVAIGELTKVNAGVNYGGAFGWGTESSHTCAFIVGQNNQNTGTVHIPSSISAPDRPLFVVGNGGNSTTRSNAFIVKANGDVVIPKAQGDISMGEFGL